ncbi:NADPH-dependent FMN reductase [Listeria weihenstephanensis]|uniref:NADPH-dependent FMN reductase n=1 Tax=Listeria weihenstephanensis TaxID=1006155 RepID=A0A841Z9N3_9LIST|nr:NADPH-dependent FMN reductase [Listeria weihenstephanensis]MBC1502025.1 NADPH-dependent FMN reductase [Listeria weihenstephanensis]
MSRIVILSGSPSAQSGTDKVLRYAGEILQEDGVEVHFHSVRDFDAEVLVNANFKDVGIRELVADIEAADGVIVGSPVYKASYTGVLKAVLDLLPENILKNKVALPIMSGGSSGHVLAIDFTLKPLLGVLKGEVLQGVYVVDSQVDKTVVVPIRDAGLEERLRGQLAELVVAIGRREVRQTI